MGNKYYSDSLHLKKNMCDVFIDIKDYTYSSL